MPQDLESTDTSAALRKRAVFMPFFGEFGHFVMTQIRFVHHHPARLKIVCCRPGDEPYFPSAESFFHEWRDPIADHFKRHTGARLNSHPECEALRARLREQFGDCEIIDVPRGFSVESIGRLRVDLKPAIERNIRVDAVLGARRRSFRAFRNFPHWDWLADRLAARGHRVGAVGARETSFELSASQANSWDWGDASATIEMLANCRLFIGTDTGTSHLAALCGAPMLIFKCPERTSGMDHMRAAARNRFEFVEDGWNNREKLLDAALAGLEGVQEARPSQGPPNGAEPSV